MAISSSNSVPSNAVDLGADFNPCAVGIELHFAHQEAIQRSVDAKEHLLSSCQNMALCEAYVFEAEARRRAAAGASRLHIAFCLLCKNTTAHLVQ